MKRIGIFGAISAGMGSIGALLSGVGICGCFVTPFMSIAAATSIIIGFLTKYTNFFIVLGIILLAVAAQPKTCKVHK